MPPSTSPKYRERAEGAETSSGVRDMEAVLAALRLQDTSPNIDDVTSALRRKLNLGDGDSGDEAVRVMADALLQWSLKEKRRQDGVSNDRGSFKENETGRTPPAGSGEASIPFTETTPTTSNMTPITFVGRKTPSTRGRDRTPPRTRSARSRSNTPLSSFFRQRSLTPARRTVDPSPNKRSQSPFRALFMRTESDATQNVPFDERASATSRPPAPPTPVRPTAITEPIVADTPAVKTEHSFPSPPSTTGKTFFSPAASTSFQWSDSSPESQHSSSTPSFPVDGSSQPGMPVPKFNVKLTKSKMERAPGPKVRRKADKRVHKAGGPEKSHAITRPDTSQIPAGPPPVPANVSGMQQTFSADSSFQSPQSTSTFSPYTAPLNVEQPSPHQDMDVSPEVEVRPPPPAPDVGFQFSIGAGDKKTFSHRSKRNSRKVGSQAIQRRTNQRTMSANFPITSPIVKTKMKPRPHADIHMNPSDETGADSSSGQTLRTASSTCSSEVDYEAKPRPHPNVHMNPSDEMGADSSGGQTLRTASNCSSEVDYTGRRGLVSSLREEARNAYTKHDFRSAVLNYTMALKVHIGDRTTVGEADDVRAVLLANRAAALLMLDAYEMAAADCQEALQFVSDQNAGLSSDSGPVLKAKLLARLGKSLLKVGNLQEAEQSFCNTINIANAALALVNQLVVSYERHENERFLTQLITDAELGKIQVTQCQEAADGLQRCSSASLQSPTASVRRNRMQALVFVNKGLQFAPGSASFHEKKLTLLASLQRWRELAGHCERLAASTSKSDGIFEGDLADKHPFPGASQTKSLEATFFDNDPVESSTKKLGVKAVAEAVLRLPHGLLPLYLRALRLEERYSQALSAIDALDNLIKLTEGSSNNLIIRVQFSWLSIEQDKVNRTQAGKDRGDALFRNGDYEAAAAEYTSCLTIDGERLVDAESGEVSNAGGRLHAILHCNRAACLMALKKYHDAVTDCTSALRIHSHYMKAMLRRSRCYRHLQRYEEASVEFNRWLELVEKAKTAPQDSELWATPCLFDSPKEILDSELEKVKKELLEVGKAKQMAENTARAEASRRDSRRRWYEESFGQNNNGGGDAQQRREHWYNQQGTSSRRWDSFAGRNPRRDAKPDQKPEQQRPQQQHGSQYDGFHRRNNSNRQQQPQHSPVSDKSADHYSVLDVARNASESQIKKAYRKMALKYHPDKNVEPEAADKFRRVKLAYETLNDPLARQKYDVEIRWNRRF